MSDNVVGLHGHPVPQVMEPHEGTIALLADLLERAKSGEILGACVVYQYRDEACQWKRAGLMSYRLLGFGYGMLAEMTEELRKSL